MIGIQQVIGGVPALAALPRVEQAKLIGELESFELDEAQGWQPAALGRSLCFLWSGELEIGVRRGETWVSLIRLAPGDLVGEPAEQAEVELGWRAVGAARLVRIPQQRFQELAGAFPRLMGHYIQCTRAHNERLLQELATSRARGIEGGESDPGAVGARGGGAAEAREAAPQQGARVADGSRRLAIVAGTLALAWGAGLVAWLGGVPGVTAASLGILLWGVLNWLAEAIPDHAVALAMIGAAAMLGLVPADVALSGFASRTWLMLLTVIAIAGAVSRSGLLYRASLHMLQRLPPTYRGQSLALALIGLVQSPFLPAVSGRQLMSSRLALELAGAMGFRAGSNGCAGLAMACYLGCSLVFFISMTGASVTLMLWSYLPGAVKEEMSWTTWFVAAVVPALFVFLLSYAAVLFLFRPEHQAPTSREVVAMQLRVLGPLSPHERLTGWVLAGLIVGFSLEPLHGFDPTWVALSGFLVLVATGVLDREALKSGIDWPFLLFLGGLLGLASVAEETGLVAWLGQWIAPVLLAVGDGSSTHVLLSVAGLTALVRLVVPLHTAVLLMSLALIPVSLEIGVHPFAVGLTVLIASTHFLLSPQGHAGYMAAHVGGEGRAFTHRQVRPFAWVHLPMTLLAVLVGIPWWRWLGLLAD